MNYNEVDTSIYRDEGLQIQDEKGRQNSNEFPHVLLKRCCTLLIKCRVALTLPCFAKYENMFNVSSPNLGDQPRILIGLIEAQLKP